MPLDECPRDLLLTGASPLRRVERPNACPGGCAMHTS
jgi:hypothetical protein